MKKTSKADFNKFKREFMYWVDVFGLKGYKIYFHHEPLNSSYADIDTDEAGKLADVRYNSLLTDHKKKKSFGPESVAKHEAIHLLLSRLFYLGVQRYTASGEIANEEEKLVRILEKVL